MALLFTGSTIFVGLSDLGPPTPKSLGLALPYGLPPLLSLPLSFTLHFLSGLPLLHSL